MAILSSWRICSLLAADSSRKRRREVIDKVAAAYILQGALDRLAVLGSENADER